MKRYSLFFAFNILLFFTTTVYSFSWADLWLTSDQQAQRALADKKPERAAQLFTDPTYQATAWYRAGNYAKAAQGFGSHTDPNGQYNLGNALALQGQYKKAVDAYNKALKNKPNDQDILFNKKIVEQLLKQQQQNKNQEQNNNKDEQKANQDQQQNTAEKKQDLKDNNTQKNQNDAKQQNIAANQNNQKKPSDQTEKTHTAQQARSAPPADEQWLNQIADDPGGLLRQKFLRDHYRQRLASQGESS